MMVFVGAAISRPPLADWVSQADDIRPYKSLRHPP